MKSINHIWICGGFLIFGGFYIFTDTKRILLSRLLTSTSDQFNSLPQPLFYYISFGLAAAGTIAVLASIIGFWASCLNTYWFLGFYFSAVALLLLAESVVCLALTLWPHCLGISLDAIEMVKALQGNYGIPGKEQFTIAMDLAQTRFKCCGMNSEINYDTSMWRLQGFGTREWVVPLTCCILNNEHEPLSYLDPKPFNQSQCETLQKVEFSKYRHTSPCLEYLDMWYREQYLLFFGGSLLVIIVEFLVLLSIILTCSKMSARAERAKDFLKIKTEGATANQAFVENIYGSDSASNVLRGRQQLPSDFKEIYIQPQDLMKSRHNTTFKPGRSQYHVSTRRYFV
ncbi:uncharacterized protein LOC129906975 isoform X2 [Episyrphus balteatus]|uniref:uncharacterized protein LOC129906975 isoform X2 n=1 Tax=Episyrphus balteatus TaxID=286459 RepID=UPI0024852115|nr:uncharacterized protein LOC129906975 isoform X2 [Episyrphus balteatus]